MEFAFAKIVIFVPETHAEVVRVAMAEAGAGRIGNYDSCSFSMKGVGRFRALDGADPFVGTIGEIEKVAEERIEVICETSRLDEVLKAVAVVHPYEEPAIDVYPLLNIKNV